MATGLETARGARPGWRASRDQKRGEVALTAEELARLLDLARALSGACEHADVSRIVAERGCALTGASAAQVAELLEGGGLAVVADAAGDAPAFLARSPSSLRAGAPEHDVASSGEPTWIRSRAEAAGRSPPLAAETLTGGPDGAAWAFLPLVADDEVHGVLTLVFDEVQTFDAPMRAFLGEVAAACGDALARGSLFSEERARANACDAARAAGELRQRRSERQVDDRSRLYERERFARARAEAETVVAVRLADDLERAQRLTAALFLADEAPDVVAALVEHGVDGFGALSLELTRRGAGGALAMVVTAGGRPRAAAAEVRPSDPGVAEAEVLRAGASLWLDPEELARRFPGSSQALIARGAGSWLGVPVSRNGDVEGVLSVAFSRERAFTMGDRERLTLLAEECASVLARRTAHGAGAAPRPAALLQAAAQPAPAFVVQYDETGAEGPVARVLGVFSSDASARAALRELDRTRSLAFHASVTSWALDVPRPLTRVELDLPE
jgi:hypothetical protein